MKTTYSKQNLTTVFSEIKQHNPLVLNLTNAVSINLVANGELAAGASPVMSSDAADAIELLKFAGAVFINIGTLNTHQNDIIKKTLSYIRSNHLSKPVILDLVGNGATTPRNQLALDCISFADIVKGNAAEISYLLTSSFAGKGVDSSINLENPAHIVKEVALKYNVMVVMTGKQDYISDGKKVFSVTGGDHFMSMFTGSGCLVGAVLAAANATSMNINNCIAACLMLKIAAEKAHSHHAGPYTSQYLMLDYLLAWQNVLADVTDAEIASRVKLS